MSDLKITPASHYDIGILANFDPVTRRVAAIGTVANIYPYKSFFLNLNNFDMRTNLQPQFDQLGFRGGWGSSARKGLNFVNVLRTTI